MRYWNIGSNNSPRFYFLSRTFCGFRLLSLFLLDLLLYVSTAGADTFEVKFNKAQALATEGNFEEAFSRAESAFAEASQKRKPNDPILAKFLNLLADLYLNQGKTDIALAYHNRALAIRRAAYGDAHYDVAESENNLGILHFKLKAYAEAENYFKASLATCEKVFPPTHPSLAFPLDNLGKLYRDTGRYVEAEELFLKALKIREKRGVSASLLMSTLQNTGKLYLLMGAYAKAEPMLTRALKIQDSRGKRDSPLAVELCRSLALVYRKLDKMEAAKKQEDRVAETLKPESPA